MPEPQCRPLLWRNESLKVVIIVYSLGRGAEGCRRPSMKFELCCMRCSKLRTKWILISQWRFQLSTCKSSLETHYNLRVITTLMEWFFPSTKERCYVLHTKLCRISFLLPPQSLSSSSFRSSHYDPIHLSTLSFTVGCNGECDNDNLVKENWFNHVSVKYQPVEKSLLVRHCASVS